MPESYHELLMLLKKRFEILRHILLSEKIEAKIFGKVGRNAADSVRIKSDRDLEKLHLEANKRGKDSFIFTVTCVDTTHSESGVLNSELSNSNQI